MLAISDGGAVLLQLLMMSVFGGICAAIASGRGRSAVGWFFVGALTGCIGIILVLVLPDMKQQEARERRVRQENRRLREQLSKERQVADERHDHISRRLGAHDEALGLDTSAPPELSTSRPSAQITGGDQWFYVRDGGRQGPVTAETLRHLLDARTINGDTLVWSDGMTDWVAVRDTDEFREDIA